MEGEGAYMWSGRRGGLIREVEGEGGLYVEGVFTGFYRSDDLNTLSYI